MTRTFSIRYILLLALFAAFLSSCKLPIGDPRIGKQVSELSAQTNSGETVVIPPEGKIVFLEFWATWCPACQRYAPEVDAFKQKIANEKDAEFISINIENVPLEEQEFAVQEYLRDNDYNWDVVFDDGSISNSYQIQSLPTTVGIGPDGKIFMVYTGLLREQDLSETLVKKRAEVASQKSQKEEQN